MVHCTIERPVGSSPNGRRGWSTNSHQVVPSRAAKIQQNLVLRLRAAQAATRANRPTSTPGIHEQNWVGTVRSEKATPISHAMRIPSEHAWTSRRVGRVLLD
ncbi:MAG: hypothetical protein CMJ36_05460 [Phycisphaerae bacterium]|nr:hypothetical protein [Phycisphaerae bacterium]